MAFVKIRTGDRRFLGGVRVTIRTVRWSRTYALARGYDRDVLGGHTYSEIARVRGIEVMRCKYGDAPKWLYERHTRIYAALKLLWSLSPGLAGRVERRRRERDLGCSDGGPF